MKRIILEALKAKFQGISESVLERIANKLAKTVATQEQVQTAVDGVTLQQVIDSYTDSRVTEASETAVRNYESRHGLKDGVKIKVENPGAPTPQPAGGNSDDNNELLRRLLEQNKRLNERLDRMDKEHTTATRRTRLDGIISKLPENLRKGYQRTAIDHLNDEEFDTLLADITAEVEGIGNEISAKGAIFGTPPASFGTPAGDGKLTKEQEEAIAKRDVGPVKDGVQPF